MGRGVSRQSAYDTRAEAMRACAALLLALLACAHAWGVAGAASFVQDCNTLTMQSDAALDAAYAASSGNVTLPPQGCYRGCILTGHGSALTAPVLQNSFWSGKCFRPDGTLFNFATGAAPTWTPTVRLLALRCTHA